MSTSRRGQKRAAPRRSTLAETLAQTLAADSRMWNQIDISVPSDLADRRSSVSCLAVQPPLKRCCAVL